MLPPTRSFAGCGLACLVALTVAGCGVGSSSSSSAAVTVPGDTLRIYVSEPAGLSSHPVARDIIDAELLAFKQHRGEVSDYHVALAPRSSAKLSENARAAIIDSTTIAYLGEVAPGASDQTVGITNALDILQLSPTDTALELTSKTPAVSGAPHAYYESWSTFGQTFARMVPSGVQEARAQVAEMRSLGVRSLYVSNDGSDYGAAIADAVAADAHDAGIAAAGGVASAAAVFYGAQSPTAAAHFFNRVAAAAPHAKLFGSSSLDSGAFTAAISSSVHNLYVSMPGFLPRALPAAGRAFVSAFRAAYGHAPNVEAIFGYAAMADLLSVLHAQGQSASNRTAVIKAFLAQRRVVSVLGTYAMDSAGNTSLDAFVFARLRGGVLTPFVAAPRG